MSVAAAKQLQDLLSNAAVETPQFAPNSRYYGLSTLTHEFADGRAVTYVKRRFIAGPETMGPVREHQLVQGERLDHIASNYLADPEQWWRIADANVALDPETLIDEPGATVRVTLPGAVVGGGS